MHFQIHIDELALPTSWDSAELQARLASAIEQELYRSLNFGQSMQSALGRMASVAGSGIARELNHHSPEVARFRPA